MTKRIRYQSNPALREGARIERRATYGLIDARIDNTKSDAVRRALHELRHAVASRKYDYPYRKGGV